MNLWQFFRTHSAVPLPRVMAVAAVAGLSNALLLYAINSGAHAVADGTMDKPLPQPLLPGDGEHTRMLFAFIVAITLYILTQRYILSIATIEVERIIQTIRVRLAEKIRAADLQSLEGLGRAQLYTSVNTDTTTISQTAMPLMIAFQSSLLLVFSLVYMFTLSRMAFGLTLAIAGVGIAINFKNRKELTADMVRSTQKENEFFETLTHLIEGFKEVKLHRARSEQLATHLDDIARQAAELKIKTGVRNSNYYILTQVMFYLLIGTMVFLLPKLSTVYREEVTEITAAILFIIGPLSLVVSLVPVLRSADYAVQNIARLEVELTRAQRKAAPQVERQPIPVGFQTIELREVTFNYTDAEGKITFAIEPVNLTIHRGEILLIIGGNGSGKSTFLKVLAGLYFPTSGEIRVDDEDVQSLGYRQYRELFSAIFSDYHLFDRLYGMENVDSQKVKDLLVHMDLKKKTQWYDGRFHYHGLSTGQRKRLALIVSLLEDRPIYIFDEWAAEQDPTFRRLFYEFLLPDLKRQGKTIIAATHDDRYFHVGDRVIKMEFGKLTALETKAHEESA